MAPAARHPNGRPDADVLKPWANGMNVTRRPAGKWIVDFGWDMDEREAAMFEEPFRHVHEHVLPKRRTNRRESYRTYWWRHAEPRPRMRRPLDGLSRCVATPVNGKHRTFVWLSTSVCPDHQLIVIAREDDVTFGILHRRFHEAWSLRLGTQIGEGANLDATVAAAYGWNPDISDDDALRRLLALTCRGIKGEHLHPLRAHNAHGSVHVDLVPRRLAHPDRARRRQDEELQRQLGRAARPRARLHLGAR